MLTTRAGSSATHAGVCSTCILTPPRRRTWRPPSWSGWIITFQFDGDVDYFEIDAVAYTPALGQEGMSAYRKRAHMGW